MKVNSVQYPFYNARLNARPSFQGGKIIDLSYVLKNRAYLLPERVLSQVEQIVASKTKKMPTLKEIHLKTYAPLLECETLEEAQRLFPEFADMKEANISFKRYTGNVQKLLETGHLEDNFSLKMLKEFWAKLKSQDEVAKEMGLEGRTSLAWVLQRIGFVNYNTNYRTLLMASDPESRAVIASKTAAWNAAHPDLVKIKNKHAAQFCKTPEYRAAHSKRMKEYDKLHPERKLRISETSKNYWSDPKNRAEQSNRGLEYEKLHPEKRRRNSKYQKAVWAKIPDMRKLLSNFFKDYVAEDKVLGARLRNIFDKNRKGQPLTAHEKIILAKYNKACMEKIPQLREALKDAHKLTKLELATQKGAN